MRRNLIVLACLLGLIPFLIRWYGTERTAVTAASPGPQVFQFESDEGNYNDGYTEPGISFLQLAVKRAPEGDFVVFDFEGTAHLCEGAYEATVQIKAILTPELSSYNPETGRIEDTGTGRERGGDQFVNFERRQRSAVPCLLEDLEAL